MCVAVVVGIGVGVNVSFVGSARSRVVVGGPCVNAGSAGLVRLDGTRIGWRVIGDVCLVVG